MADVTIVGDPAISSVHFALDCAEEKCRLRDLQSQNGTRLNDVSVPYATIYNGDTFVAGKTEFKISIDGGTDAPDATLRTWVFEDLVRRRFATFRTQELGDDCFVIDSANEEPSPIELLRRMARHQDIVMILDTAHADIAPWRRKAERAEILVESATEKQNIASFQIPDIEQVVDPLSAIWPRGVLISILPHQGRDEPLPVVAAQLRQLIAEGAIQPADFADGGRFVDALAKHSGKLAEFFSEIEAVFVCHTEPKYWRMLCNTEMVSRLNQLGYLPAG